MVSSYLDQFLIIYYILWTTLFCCINVNYATLKYLKQCKNSGFQKYKNSSISILASFKCQLYWDLESKQSYKSKKDT